MTATSQTFICFHNDRKVQAVWGRAASKWRFAVPTNEAADFTQGGGVGAPRGVEPGGGVRAGMGVESDANPSIKSMDFDRSNRLHPPARGGVESGGGVTLSLREEILLLVATEPLGSAEIARRFGFRRVFGNLARRITTLLDDKLIEPTIPEKPNSSLQKYRITKKGKKLAKLLAGNRRKPSP